MSLSEVVMVRVVCLISVIFAEYPLRLFKSSLLFNWASAVARFLATADLILSWKSCSVACVGIADGVAVGVTLGVARAI